MLTEDSRNALMVLSQTKEEILKLDRLKSDKSIKIGGKMFLISFGRIFFQSLSLLGSKILIILL